MSELSQRVKNCVSPWPRLSSSLSGVYHAVNFRRIARARLTMYEQQLRLHRYFESIYQAELDYLREHCRSLEKQVAKPNHSSAMPVLFPAVPEETRTTRTRKGIYVKHYSVKNRWAGLDERQAAYLEAESLRRLEDGGSSRINSGHYPFPRLLSVSEADPSVVMSSCGRSLDMLDAEAGKLQVPEHKQQIAYIVDRLVHTGVMHLDLRPDGKNLCVDAHGNLSLIDFDIVALQGEPPLSYQIKRRSGIALRFPGGYEGWARSKLMRALERHQDALELL